ncbi:hypothetical protein LZC95_19810 [Pendulispora brunnea]|uniref:Uncharacterized protein n=1 Tax=Pendulispora brunnea TaxID=2905690 RepID=A0ABZ2KN86_9BACT
MAARRGGPERFRVEQVAEALRMSAGIFTAAANKLGCAPNTIKNYVQRHPSLQAVCDEAQFKTLDLAESKLLAAIGEGNLTAVIFYLKCRGKARGYVERAEISGPDGGAVPVLDVTRLTDEQLERLAAGEDPARVVGGGGT